MAVAPGRRADRASRILAGYDDAFGRIDGLVSKLRGILAPDMLRILGHRLIQLAEEIEPAPDIKHGSAYGWRPARLVVRDEPEYRAVRLMSELEDGGLPEREIVDALLRHQVANRAGRLEWRAARLRVVLGRERGRRSMLAGIDAPGSPLSARTGSAVDVPAEMSAE